MTCLGVRVLRIIYGNLRCNLSRNNGYHNCRQNLVSPGLRRLVRGVLRWRRQSLTCKYIRNTASLFPQLQPMAPTANDPPIFPQELFDLIIDYTHKRPRVLQRCALVCRAWVSASRYHLINGKIELSHDTRLNELEDLIASPLNTVAALVVRVILNRVEESDFATVARIAAEFLPNVIALDVVGDLRPRNYSLLMSPVPISPRITEVALKAVGWSDTRHLGSFLQLFTCAEKLSLDVLIFAGGDGPSLSTASYIPWAFEVDPNIEVSQRLPLPNSLRSMRLGCTWAASGKLVLAWLLLCAPLPPLTKLCIADIGRVDVRSGYWSELFLLLSPSLRTLQLVFTETAIGEGVL